MKKCFLFLSMILFSCSFNNSIFGVEGEGVEAPEKPAEEPVEYKDPKNYEQAKKEWDRSEEDLKEAQDKEDDVKKQLREMTKLQREGKVTLDDVRDFLDKEYGPAVKKRTAIEEAQKKLSKNKLVDQYKKELEAAYEPPVKEPIEEPSWWTRLTKRANAWFKERQADYYNWLGNKEKVVEIRTDLAEVYGDLGTNGLLDKARNRKQLSQDVGVLEKKISHGLDAFEEYKLALDEGGITEKQKNEIKDEIRELSIDLIKLREELKTEGIDQLKREIIDKKIDDVLEKFGIGKEERVELEKQAGIEPEKPEQPEKPEVPEGPPAPTERKEIKKLTLDVSNMTDGRAWAEAIFSDPLNYAENPKFKDFVTQLDVLSRVDVAKLPANERVLLRETVTDGYQNLYDTLSMRSVDPGLSPEAKMVSLVRFIELSNKFGEVREKFNQEFATFSEANAREATPEEMKNEKGEITKPLSEGFTDKFTEAFDKAKHVEKIMDRINAGDDEGILKNYNEFYIAMTSWKERVDQAAVNQESLDVRENMLKVYADLMRKMNELSRQKDISSPEVARILVDIQIKDAALARALEADRSALVILQEKGPKLVGELLKERARLSDETLLAEQDKVRKQAAAEQELLKQRWEQLSSEDQKGMFLNEIKMGVKLKPTEPMEKSKDVDQLVDQLAQQAKEKQADLPPDIQEKLRAAKTEPQLKNAVAELTYVGAKEALKPTKTKEAKAPKDWWAEYVATGAEPKEKPIVPPGGDASRIPG